ncbi:MAG TPA: YceI family protein [Chitinophagaceae bacterium]|jgi:hypothetical protein|nr:YceI family protein [Chitinophagaceae bacterium]
MKILIILLLILCFHIVDAQTFTTRNGYVGFYSKTDMEDIRAEHKQVYGVIDAGSKRVAFTMLVKGFVFRKQLMQEHFNENYIESDTYPKASFTGTYTGEVKEQTLTSVQVRGQMTLHGVTKEIQIPGTLHWEGNKLTGKANFKLDPADFNIKIPALVRDKIAKQIDVTVLMECNATK